MVVLYHTAFWLVAFTQHCSWIGCFIPLCSLIGYFTPLCSLIGSFTPLCSLIGCFIALCSPIGCFTPLCSLIGWLQKHQLPLTLIQSRRHHCVQEWNSADADRITELNRLHICAHYCPPKFKGQQIISERKEEWRMNVAGGSAISLPDEGCFSVVIKMKRKVSVKLNKESLWLGAVRKIFSLVSSDPDPGLLKLAMLGGQGGASVSVALRVRCVIVCFYFGGGSVCVERVQPLALFVVPNPFSNSLCTHTHTNKKNTQKTHTGTQPHPPLQSSRSFEIWVAMSRNTSGAPQSRV